ncbi:MAG: FecR domain-containing protein [Pseudomonadota bacterium]
MSALAQAPSAAVVDQAIGWMVKLQSGEASADDWDACKRWRDARPDHAVAWERVQGIHGRFNRLPGRAMDTLENARRDTSRRRAMQALGLAFIGGTSVWLVRHTAPVDALMADLRTGVGERRQLTLADGSALWLDTDTAVDVRFTQAQRQLMLHRGRVLLSSGADTGARQYRPLAVATRDGNVRALGTRFMVTRAEQDTQTQVFEHAVELQPLHGPARVLKAGEQARFNTEGVTQLRAADTDTDAWTDGLLVTRGMRLGDLVTELARYQRGRLACDPAIANLRVSGVFSLQDVDQTLTLLEKSQPIRVSRLTRYWVSLQPR